MLQFTEESCLHELLFSHGPAALSNFRMHQNCQQGMLKCRLLGPIPRVADLEGLMWGFISNNLPEDGDAAGPGTTLENHCPTCITNYNDIIEINLTNGHYVTTNES